MPNWKEQIINDLRTAEATSGVPIGPAAQTITSGVGAPTAAAPTGSLYIRTDGGGSTTFYVRESGSWSAK